MYLALAGVVGMLMGCGRGKKYLPGGIRDRCGSVMVYVHWLVGVNGCGVMVVEVGIERLESCSGFAAILFLM